ncbi:PAS domain-containing protein, partial [Staphylococcus aureus]
IRFVNPAFTRLFGYAEADVVGRSTHFMYEDPADFERAGQRHYREEAPIGRRPFQMRYRHSQGTVFWAETIGLPIV